jgi:probable F420-dependent oxidoreductase
MLIDQYLRAALDDVPETARELEGRGVDGLYTAEGPHEPFLPLMLAAEHTTRPMLFTNIAVAFARSPMDLAQVADGLQRASAGRFVLGLGSQIRPHIEHRFSMTWSNPVTRMREMVQAIKSIQRAWSGEAALDFRGDVYRHTLMTPFFDPGPNPNGAPPVWVAGLGPKMTACAAEAADGLLVHPFHTGDYVRDCTSPAVADGLSRSGRSRNDFTVHATPIVCTGGTDEELARAEQSVRHLLAFYGSTPSYRVSLDQHGLGDLQPELNSLTKQGRWDEIGDRVPDEVVELFVVRGKPGEIAQLIERRYDGAVDRVALSMPYETSDETVAAVIDGFRQP